MEADAAEDAEVDLSEEADAAYEASLEERRRHEDTETEASDKEGEK